MDEKYIYSLELQHHGIKGMKWGIRRTKEQLGYKIADARKKHKANATVRKQKRAAKREEKRAEKERIKAIKKLASKSVTDMTIEELQERAYRLSMERQVLNLQKDVSNLSTKEVSGGKRFLQNVGSKVIAPALMEGGKKALTDFVEKKLKDKFGLSMSDPLSALKDEAAKLKLESNISTYKENIASNEEKARNRQQNNP